MWDLESKTGPVAFENLDAGNGKPQGIIGHYGSSIVRVLNHFYQNVPNDHMKNRNVSKQQLPAHLPQKGRVSL